MNIEQKIICLMGPTACGKTQLAIDLVQQFPCDIISVDSAMVYRDMDIGTAKPSLQELHKAPHRLINICDPATPYSAGQFCVDARREIKSIHAQGRIPLLVGGTMLYFHLLQHGVAELPTADQAVREKISQQARENGWPVLHQQLKKIDPKIAAAIHPHDSQRIQRALEVYYTTGQTMSDIQNAQPLNALSYKNINIVVAYEERATLHRKIAQRFAQMLEDGFIAEVQRLYERGDLHSDLPALRTVGYRQVWSYLTGEYDYATMCTRAIVATRQLAKRQYTWLRRWQHAHWFASEDQQLCAHVTDYVSSKL